MQEFVSIIQSVGFPIAACVALYVQQNKLTSTLGELTKTLAVINSRLDNIEDALHIEGSKNE